MNEQNVVRSPVVLADEGYEKSNAGLLRAPLLVVRWLAVVAAVIVWLVVVPIFGLIEGALRRLTR
ncbi:MAG: hypothetical protein E6G14_14105 [Actinobacteria bacterium]|nr:MAG: hypothetical protein E6G60_12940 [Actinomycetota bacterium]TML66863.1 MAG: hypothetical protein E6G14_14105 [Actinomycetota bacterium]